MERGWRSVIGHRKLPKTQYIFSRMAGRVLCTMAQTSQRAHCSHGGQRTQIYQISIRLIKFRLSWRRVGVRGGGLWQGVLICLCDRRIYQ